MASRSKVLNTGTGALGRALGDGVRIPIGRFRVGDASNFEPDEAAIGPSGNLVYTAYTDKISIDILSDNELKSTLTFTEDAGDFNIGNIVLDLLVEDEYVPFLIWVSDIPIPKIAFNKDTGAIGNRLALSFTEKVENIDEVLDINVLPTIYASLPQFSNEVAVPPAATALFQTGILQTWGTSFRPALFARRSIDDTYFGSPLLDRIDSPYFGERDGGITGTIKAPYNGIWMWGGHFGTPDADYEPEIAGGGRLSDKDDAYGDTLVGEPLNYGVIK